VTLYKSGKPNCEGSHKPKRIKRKIAIFRCLFDRNTGSGIGGRKKLETGYFSNFFAFLHDLVSKEHRFSIANSDCYHVYVIMNCALNELKIDQNSHYMIYISLLMLYM